MKNDPLQRAISACTPPTARELARRINELLPSGESITDVAVRKWRKTGIPAERCILVEKISGVERYDLRRDVFGDKRAAARALGLSVQR